ncbi:MAG TPA: hypothetical protein VGB14_21165 [Acidimicrobiales bacterium]
MTDDVQDQPEVAALIAATRAWYDATGPVVGDARATTWLRAMLRGHSVAALVLLAARSPRQKADLLPEIVLDLDGPLTAAVLAADVIRTFPRRELAIRLPSAVEEVIDGFAYEGYQHLANLLVELGDLATLEVVLAAAASHDDPDVQELGADLVGAHLDPARWGLAASERGGPPRPVRYTVRLTFDDGAVEHTVVTPLGPQTAVATAARREGGRDGELVAAHVVRADPVA